MRWHMPKRSKAGHTEPCARLETPTWEGELLCGGKPVRIGAAIAKIVV